MKIVSTELAEDVQSALGWERMRAVHRVASLSTSDAGVAAYRELAAKLRGVIETAKLPVGVSFLALVSAAETLITSTFTQPVAAESREFKYDDDVHKAN